MAIEGTLDELRLTDILQMVGQQQKTGILTVQGESTIVAVSFLGGRVVGADSLEETVEERLGEMLVRRGMLSREEFTRVVEEQRAGKGRLVDLLVDGGYLDREQVLDSLHRQTTELLSRLVEWEHGDFKFYANDEVAYEEGFRPIAVDELLLSLLPMEDEPEEDEPGEEGAGQEAAGPAAGERLAEERLAEVVPLSAAGRGGPEAPSGEEGRDALTALPEEVAEPDWREVSWSGEEVDASGEPEPAGPAPTEPTSPAPASAPAPPPPAEAPPRPARADAVPADPAEEEARPTPRERPSPTVGRAAAEGWLAAGLGVLLAITLVVALLRHPGDFLLPLPWQQGELQAYHDVQRKARFQTIDSAAKTYFLKEVRFPASLDRLVELSLLLPGERVGPEGRPLELIPRDESYELRIAASEGGEAVSLEAITGDFLLDPGFLTASDADRSPPLVLLD